MCIVKSQTGECAKVNFLINIGDKIDHHYLNLIKESLNTVSHIEDSTSSSPLLILVLV